MTTQLSNDEARNTRKARQTRVSNPRTSVARVTKKAQLIRLLQRKDGADVTAISKKLGWQPHTTRAALTGLRKAGYEIVSARSGNGHPSRYRIAAEPAKAG